MNDSVVNICQELGVLFIDCSKLYISHPEYFNDATHLNAIGADIYTKHIASILQGN